MEHHVFLFGPLYSDRLTGMADATSHIIHSVCILTMRLKGQSLFFLPFKLFDYKKLESKWSLDNVLHKASPQ